MTRCNQGAQKVLDALAVPVFWAARTLVTWVLRWSYRHPTTGGFNAEVDAQRLLSIRAKLTRGQKFLTAPDGWFLLEQIDKGGRS